MKKYLSIFILLFAVGCPCLPSYPPNFKGEVIKHRKILQAYMLKHKEKDPAKRPQRKHDLRMLNADLKVFLKLEEIMKEKKE